MIRSAFLVQMDGQTDGIGVAYTALSIASRGKNEACISLIGYRIS